MRRNADLFGVLTTTGETSLKHLYGEYAALDFASYQDFVGNQMNTTKDYGVMIIDNTDPNLRGLERFKKWTSSKLPEELPSFVMLCPAAWGARDRDGMLKAVEEQRKKLKLGRKYSESYMQKLKNAGDTKMTRAELKGLTLQHVNAQAPSTESILQRLAAGYSRKQ